jgi:predicted MFS family arabinose efflux permease
VSAADLRSLRRRFHLLLALRFVPTGLFVTVFVLLMLDRGLSLAQIGLGTAAQGIVMLFLELPSGGLADALGRKPVLILATLFSIVASSLLLVADTVWLLAVASALMGVFRALDSGPLESWFIDASLAADRDVDIEGGLARQNVVICSAIGVGAMLGGAIAATDGVLGIDPLVAPIALGLVVQVVGLVALIVLMHEVRSGEGWAAARRSIGEVPEVVGGAMRLIRASSLLTALVIAELLWGFGMIAFEVFLPPRLVEVSSGVEQAARLLGPSITAAWALSAVGAACAPWLVRRFGSGVAGCTLRVVHGLTVVGMGLAVGPAGLIVAYLACYWTHGATAPVHYGMVHRAVESSHRATVVSANSLTSQLGGALSGIALGALADATSISTAMFVAAVVLAAAGPLYLVGRDTGVDLCVDDVPPPLLAS